MKMGQDRRVFPPGKPRDNPYIETIQPEDVDHLKIET